jgi:diguanylate cyclase (GGDEF)-like protein
VSFGRRLALFFILIALVPTLALLGMLAIISQDSRTGKADSRLAAGVETALAVYEEDVAAAEAVARELSGRPELGAALTGGTDPGGLMAFATSAVSGEVVAVQVLDPQGGQLTSAGDPNAVAFATIDLTRAGQPSGSLRVSVTSSSEFASEVQRLTGDELVLLRGGDSLEATVTLPADPPGVGETANVDSDGTGYRAHLLDLDPSGGEQLLLLGPREEGGFLGLDGSTAALLIGFLILGIVLAWTLARTLTGLHAQVAEQAVTDPLTGLSNRRRMHQLLVREVARAKRFGHELSMVIIDIDDFKQINDRLGHLQGDAVLESIADTVRETTRLIDIGARYGGDELALVLLETGADGALIVADRLRERVDKTEIPLRDGGTMKVTVSVGVATLPDNAQEVDDLIEAADQALLQAKRSGKDQTRAAPR